MDLVLYLRTLRRRWVVIVVAAVIGAGLAVMFVPRPKTVSSNIATVWVSSQTLLARNNNGGASGSISYTLPQIESALTNGEVAQRVATADGVDPTEIEAKVSVSADQKLSALNIFAKGDTADAADKLALDYSGQVITWVNELQQQQLDTARTAEQARRDQAQSQLDAITGTDAAANAQRQSLQKVIADSDATLAQYGNDAVTQPLEAFSSRSAVAMTPGQVALLFKNANSSSNGNGNGNNKNAAASDLLANAQEKKPSSSFGLNPAIAAVGGATGGALAAIALVLIVAALDPRIFTKEDAEAALGFPVVAEIPCFNRRQRRETDVISSTAPYSRFAEAYRVLRSSIVFVERAGRRQNTTLDVADTEDADESRAPAKRATVVMVTSPGPSEGKTTTTSNLAAVLAEDGSQVLVVNCDFRRPRLHQYLHTGHDARRVIETPIPGVKFVADVVDDHRLATPAEVVKAQRGVVAAARDVFDYILLDTAPLLTTNDASDVLPVTDMVVVVCRSGKTTKEAADRAAELLERFDAPVIGAALIGATDAPSARYYYYYETSDQAREDIAPRPSVNPLSALLDEVSQDRDRSDDAPDRPQAEPTAQAAEPDDVEASDDDVEPGLTGELTSAPASDNEPA